MIQDGTLKSVDLFPVWSFLGSGLTGLEISVGLSVRADKKRHRPTRRAHKSVTVDRRNYIHVSQELFEVQKRQTTFLIALNKRLAMIQMLCCFHEEIGLNLLISTKDSLLLSVILLKLPFCRLILVQPNCLMVRCSPKQQGCNFYIISSWTYMSVKQKIKLYYRFDDFKIYKLLTNFFVVVNLQLVGQLDLSWTGQDSLWTGQQL